MRFACVMSPEKGGNDRLLSEFARNVMARGYRPAGLVQENVERPDQAPCDMLGRVLPDGPVFQISQYRGQQARGCRLDTDAFETAVAHVSRSLAQGDVDLLILNKFGVREAAGGGFCGVIADAIERDIPVIIGLNPLNEAAFAEYTQGLAQRIPARVESLVGWLDQARAA